MNSSPGIDEIIRPLSGEHEQLHYGDGQFVACFDRHQQKIVDEPRWSFFGRSTVEKYLVTTDKEVNLEFIINVPSSLIKVRLPITFRYSIAIPKKEKNKAVERLAKGFGRPIKDDQLQNLSKWIELQLKKAWQDYYEHEIKNSTTLDAVRDFFDWRCKCQAYLEESLRKSTGLATTVTLDAGAEDLSTIKLDSSEISISVPDYRRHEFRFGTRISFAVSAEHKIIAMARVGRSAKLKEEALELIENYINDNCTIEDIYRKRNEIEEKLLPKLKECALRYGRKVTLFALEFHSLFALPKLDNVIPYEHDCPIQGWAVPIKVEHRVLLQLDSVCKYLELAERQLDVEDWLKEALNRVTGRIMLNQTYIEVATRFKANGDARVVGSGSAAHPYLEDEIREAMIPEARKYGMSLLQYSWVPQVEAIKVQRGFDIRIRDTFPTKSPRVDVELEIVGEGHIPTHKLKDIQNDFHPNRSIEEVIQEHGRNAVRSVMNGMNPRKFYFQFENPKFEPRRDEIVVKLGESVENELARTLKDSLENRFGVICKQVTVKQHDTALTRRLQGLLQPNESVFFEVTPNDGGPRQKYEFVYYIQAVDEQGWEQFMNMDGVYKTAVEELNVVSAFIKNAARGRLQQTSSRVELQFKLNEHREWIQQVVFDDPEHGVKKEVLDRYGFAIAVSGFTRVDVEEEADGDTGYHAKLRLQKEHEDSQIQRLRLERDTLIERRLKLLSGDDLENNDELESIKKEIDKIDKDLIEAYGAEGAMSIRSQTLLNAPDLRGLKKSLLPPILQKRLALPPPTSCAEGDEGAAAPQS